MPPPFRKTPDRQPAATLGGLQERARRLLYEVTHKHPDLQLILDEVCRKNHSVTTYLVVADNEADLIKSMGKMTPGEAAAGKILLQAMMEDPGWNEVNEYRLRVNPEAVVRVKVKPIHKFKFTQEEQQEREETYKENYDPSRHAFQSWDNELLDRIAKGLM